MNDFYTCPHCQGNGTVINITPIMSDVRYDTIRCAKCGCTWKMYYKVSEPYAEVVKGPDEVAEQGVPENAPAKKAPSKEKSEGTKE